jgi:hypothetical protein
VPNPADSFFTRAEMALRQDLRTYQEKMNRRFWVIVVPLMAAPLLLLPAIQRSVPRGAVPKWVLVVIPAVLLGFVVFYVTWAYEMRPRRLGHRYPGCSQALTGYAARVVIDTGRCPRCQIDLP